MDLIAGIERLTALTVIVTGLSHIAAPLGLLILAFHPVWSGPGLLITLIGCGLTVKGTVYFLWPELAARTMAHVSEATAGRFRIAGFFGLALGLICGWIAFGLPGL